MISAANTVAVVSTFNQTAFLDLCLHSFALHSPEVRVVVVDASGGTVVDSLDGTARKRIAKVVTTDRTPHPVTMHRGIEAARDLGAEFVVQSNDDLVAPPEWLRIFANEWEAIERDGNKLGLLGASTNHISGPQCRITGDFGSADIKECRAIRLFFGVHSVESYFAVGGYPFDLPGNWFGDDVLALRYIRAGYKNFVSRLFVPHFGSRSMAGSDLSDEKSKGEFYMTRHYPGWRKELYGPA